jgi:hypothetical protein
MKSFCHQQQFTSELLNLFQDDVSFKRPIVKQTTQIDTPEEETIHWPRTSEEGRSEGTIFGFADL